MVPQLLLSLLQPLPGIGYLRVTAWPIQAVEAGLQDLVPGEDHCLRIIQQPCYDPGEGMGTNKAPAVGSVPVHRAWTDSLPQYGEQQTSVGPRGI